MLIAIGAIALWAIIATIEVVSRDGYGATPYAWNYDTRTGSAAPTRMH